MTYIEAVDYLVKESRWKRQEVIDDGTSAAWFCAARAKTPEAAAFAQAAGVIVAQGRDQ